MLPFVATGLLISLPMPLIIITAALSYLRHLQRG